MSKPKPPYDLRVEWSAKEYKKQLNELVDGGISLTEAHALLSNKNSDKKKSYQDELDEYINSGLTRTEAIELLDNLTETDVKYHE